MSSVSQTFMKLFRGSSGAETIPAQGSQKLTRRSSVISQLGVRRRPLHPRPGIDLSD